jgi:hypothetical protein
MLISSLASTHATLSESKEADRMNLNRKVLALGAAIVVVAAGGVGIAYAVGGDSEEQVTGPDADKAKSAALDAVGGGTVTEIERQEAGGAGVYEVEVERADGSEVEVHIDDRFKPVGTEADDDTGAGEEEDEVGEAEDD